MKLDFNKLKLDLTQAEEEWLDNHRKITVSGPLNFPPFHFFSEEGEAFGIASDYVRFITDTLGVEIESYKKLPWPEVLEDTKEKKIDLIACSAWSPEREKYLNFTDSYLSFPLVIISRDDFKFIGGLEDLYDLKVSIVKGTVVYEWLKDDMVEIIPHFTNTPLNALEEVSEGKTDAYIGNLAAVSYLISKHGFTNLKIAAPTHYKNYELFISVRDDWPELVSIINKWFSAVEPQQHSAIRNNWLSVKYEYGISYIDIAKYIAISAFFFAVIITIIVLWNRQLQREIINRKKAEAEKENVIVELKEALDNIDLLGDLLPICARCRKIRDDKGYWNQLEYYLEENAVVSFSHGICPDCEKELYGNEDWYNKI